MLVRLLRNRQCCKTTMGLLMWLALCTSMCQGQNLINYNKMTQLLDRIQMYHQLPPDCGAIADTIIGEYFYKRLIPDTSAVFKGRETLDCSPFDSSKPRATAKIGVIWVWQTSASPDAIRDDALYMSLWDRTKEFPDSNCMVVSIELAKMDCGDDIKHLLILDGIKSAEITWVGLGRNNPFWYRWWIRSK